MTAAAGSDVVQSGRPIFDDFFPTFTDQSFHQPIKRTKQSVFLDVTVFQHTLLWISFTPNAAVLFVDVAIQPEVRFIAKQNSLMKIGNTYSAQNHYFRNKIAQFESVVQA
ncbi:hypothetical protein TNCV_3915341 [Trichonephila clavipes]|nr:hypothetical protein TNCV_3915341 [Trichonephila clavipes]